MSSRTAVDSMQPKIASLIGVLSGEQAKYMVSSTVDVGRRSLSLEHVLDMGTFTMTAQPHTFEETRSHPVNSDRRYAADVDTLRR